MNKAIEAGNICKSYRLYQKPFDRLKEAVIRRPLHQNFDSLKNITFTVSCGESLGIIGENGAGKSTLLKILAGTLTPTSGSVSINGRVAALLELGAGFHFEFTGRQNIYLNASLLGLSHAEILEKEHDIIQFAELGVFIDRPIKTYSSGMVVRLAFSIATSVNPDILIIDEALSVGDQYFQKKCVDRMRLFQEQGKTILFCSHALYLVNLLCRQALWIHEGTIRSFGNAAHVTAAYENYLREKSGKTDSNSEPENPSLPIVIKSIRLNGILQPITLKYHDELTVVLEYESKDDRPFWAAIGIRRNDDLICHAVSMSGSFDTPLRGSGRVKLRYPSLPFLFGQFFIVAVILDETGLHWYHKKESAPFTIIPPDNMPKEIGLLDLDHEWEIL